MITLKTAQKIALARIACSFILSARKLRGLLDHVIVNRNGIFWNLDLTEGIDFSIYLLGAFEPATVRLYNKLVKSGDVVLDIGANIGAHTLPLARLVGEKGQVIAFEPTRYAITKMKANIVLNKELNDRILVKQVMRVADDGEVLDPEIYSSWPLFNDNKEIHPVHRGQKMNTEGAVAMTLETAIHQMHLPKIDFIKLDVDGKEYSILKGGKEIISKDLPPILMELAPYLYHQESGQFEEMIGLFDELGYSILDANSGKILPMNPERLRDFIPNGVTRNILLIKTRSPQKIFEN